MKKNKEGSRIKLIKRGIDDIREHGISRFSLRRVAKSCKLSCAAPYKYFASKNSMLIEIFNYISDQWREIQDVIYKKYASDNKSMLVEMCMAYINFIIENPQFRDLLMMDKKEMGDELYSVRRRVTADAYKIAGRYADSVGMGQDELRFKFFEIRSLIYGAVFAVGEIENDEKDEMRCYLRKRISEVIG